MHTRRTFQAWEGGGEYNVARGLRRCFALRTAIVTALADNPVGRQGPLPQVKMLQTGGITAANAAEFLAAGAVALGVGSELVDTVALAEGRDATITERARELCAVVQAFRAARIV